MGGHSIMEGPIKTYNDCLQQGIFPDWWKKGFIIPLYKKDDRHKCNNYRSIKLLPVIIKSFKCILTKRIHAFLTTKLHDSQAGFRKKFEALEQHIYTLGKIRIALFGRENQLTLVTKHKIEGLLGCFWIYQKHLTVYGGRVSFSNYIRNSDLEGKYY